MLCLELVEENEKIKEEIKKFPPSLIWIPIEREEKK